MNDSDSEGLSELEGDSHYSYTDTEFDNTVDHSVDADHQIINPAILGYNQGEPSEVEQPPPRENPVTRVGHLINFPVLFNTGGPLIAPVLLEPENVNPPPLSEEVESNERCDENYSRKRKARDLGKSICLGDYVDIDTGTFAYHKLQVGPAAGSAKASCSNCIPGVHRLTPDMIPTLSDHQTALQLMNLNRVKEDAYSILKEVILHMMYQKTQNQNNLALPVEMLNNNNELQAPSMLPRVVDNNNHDITTTTTTSTGHGIHYSIAENLMYNPYYYHYMIQTPTFRQLVAHLVTTIIEKHYTNHHDQPRHGEDKGPTGRNPP